MRRQDLLDLNEVLQHPGRAMEVELSTDMNEEEELDLVAPVEGVLQAVSTGNLLLITGKFATRVVVECARCGGPLEKDLEFEVDEQFPVEGTPSSFSSQDFARVVPEEPYEMFDGNQLMVEALLRQMLIVNLPVQPLCEFGWDGPCPIALARQPEVKDEPGHPLEMLKKLLDPREPES